MDSLFEQGCRGRRNTLIVGVHGTGSGGRSSLYHRPQLDDILGKIAPARTVCKIPTRAANCILAEEEPPAVLPSITASLPFKSDTSCCQSLLAE